MSKPASLPERGDGVASIDTPALVIDLDAMERNLATMATFARSHGVRLRPQAKMHKCAAITRLRMAAGAVGVCVQKTSEAEALAAAGIADLHIANEVIAPAKLARVAALARQVRLAIAVDSAEGVERLAAARRDAQATIDVFVEVDDGHGRCGVPAAAAGVLAQHVVSHAPPEGGLRFAGPAGLSRRGPASARRGRRRRGPQVARHRFRAAAGSGSATSSSPTAATSTASCARATLARPSGCHRSARRSGSCPGIATPTVNLHERCIAVRGGLDCGVIEAVWTIEARGCIARRRDVRATASQPAPTSVATIIQTETKQKATPIRAVAMSSQRVFMVVPFGVSAEANHSFQA